MLPYTEEMRKILDMLGALRQTMEVCIDGHEARLRESDSTEAPFEFAEALGDMGVGYARHAILAEGRAVWEEVKKKYAETLREWDDKEEWTVGCVYLGKWEIRALQALRDSELAPEVAQLGDRPPYLTVSGARLRVIEYGLGLNIVFSTEKWYKR